MSETYGWNRPSTAPKDGTLFVFRSRSPATYELTLPMIGRYCEGELQCHTGSRWRRFDGDMDCWTAIPGFGSEAKNDR